MSRDPFGPVAQKSPLGWTVIGNLDKCSSGAAAPNTLLGHVNKINLIPRELPWSRTLTGGKLVNPDDRQAIGALVESMSKGPPPENRVTASPLWRDEARPGCNFSAARETAKGLYYMLQALDISDEYDGVLDKLEAEGYVKALDAGDPDSKQGYFLPHFAVIRRDKQSTKVRVVMNGKAVFSGKSLNDCFSSSRRTRMLNKTSTSLHPVSETTTS